MQRLLALAAGLLLILSTAARAEDPVVVELFTSQGCSSCPPADEMVAELASDDDVIALSFHVDYWDYIGWEDGFARPENTDRQRAYARAAGSSTIYTPQIIVGGSDHVIGFKPMRLMKALEKHAARRYPVEVDLDRQGDRVTVRAMPVTGTVGAAVVTVVTYIPEATVDIQRGENAGRSLRYTNIVKDLKVLGDWNGEATFQATVTMGSDLPVVALVQRPSGPVLGAAALR